MKKKAILIASDNETKKEMISLNSDIKFLRSFLKFTSGQLVRFGNNRFNKPNDLKLLFYTLVADNNYQFLYFSGHGWISNGKQYVIIENNALEISVLLIK